jgi:hypothetical protein
LREQTPQRQLLLLRRHAEGADRLQQAAAAAVAVGLMLVLPLVPLLLGEAPLPHLQQRGCRFLRDDKGCFE